MMLEEAIRVVADELSTLRNAISATDGLMWAHRNVAVQKANWHARSRLISRGAVVSEVCHGAMIKLAGIRSTSTCGLAGALANWLVAARKRVAAQQENAHGQD